MPSQRGPVQPSAIADAPFPFVLPLIIDPLLSKTLPPYPYLWAAYMCAFMCARDASVGLRLLRAWVRVRRSGGGGRGQAAAVSVRGGAWWGCPWGWLRRLRSVQVPVAGEGEELDEVVVGGDAVEEFGGLGELVFFEAFGADDVVLYLFEFLGHGLAEQ